MWTREGMFHCEHNVLVTAAGNEILSAAPLELTEAAVALDDEKYPLSWLD